MEEPQESTTCSLSYALQWKKKTQQYLGGGFQIFSIFTPKIGEDESTHFDERAYFSDGLVKNHQPVIWEKVGHLLNQNFGDLRVFLLGCVFRVFRVFRFFQPK